MKRKCILMTMAVVFCAAVAQAEVTVAKVFGDNMVLQRDMEVPVWGWADPGEKVTVQFANQKKSAEADKTGKWMIRLDPMPANAKGRTLVVTAAGGNRKLEIGNVLVGEVWLCSGQSNMEWLVKQSEGADEAGQRAKNHSQIRLRGCKTITYRI